MNQLLRDFHEHPQSVGETYPEHWWTAMGFALTLLGSSLACMVHAFVPGLFKGTASRTITELHRRMVTHRNRRAHPDGRAAQPSR
ncbi:MAG: DUF6356 family protein [Pseudomonadales bacterium]